MKLLGETNLLQSNPFKPLSTQRFSGQSFDKDLLLVLGCLLLLCLSPVALLIVNYYVPNHSTYASGRWPPDSPIEHRIALLGVIHSVFVLIAVTVSWRFSRKMVSKICVTVFAVASTPAMLYALLVVTMSKTGKWL